MDEIQHLLKQRDSNSKIAGLVLAINHLKNAPKHDMQTDLEVIYQSMGRKFLFKLLSSQLFIEHDTKNKNNEQNKQELQLNSTSLTCYKVAISITIAMINNPSINEQIIAGILPFLSNILSQIILFQKSNNKVDTKLNIALNAINNSIIDCAFMILQCYHNHNADQLIRYYIATKSNHYNQRNAENANVYSMALSFLKYLSSLHDTTTQTAENENEQKEQSKSDDNAPNTQTNQLDRNKKALKIIEFMILHCQNPNDTKNKSLILTQRIFLKSMIKSYKHCQSKLKLEYPSLILSIFYHLFGDTLSSTKNTKISQTLSDCLLELRHICMDSLASRMEQNSHRLDICKLIQISLQFQGHKWFTNTNNKKAPKSSMTSEKLMLFVLSSVSNEIRIVLETKPSWIVDAECIDTIDTNLYIFEKLVSFIISEDEQIDAWITTFSSNTMHALQQNIHNAINALFFYITELKQAVFEKQNDDGLKEQNCGKNASETDAKVQKKMKEVQNEFDALSMSDILNENCLKLLDRILYGITSYITYDLVTFTDHFVGILEFILVQFDDRFFIVLCNVISKILTPPIAENKEYKAMIVKQLYANDFLFDIVIRKILKTLAFELTSGHQHDMSQLFEIENQFLSVSLLIHDVFVWKNNKFIKGVFNEEKKEKGYFELLIQIICRIGVVKQTQESVLPLLFVVLRTINKTSDKKLERFVRNGMRKHVQNLIKIASACQKFEHSCMDDIAMDLVQLRQQ